MSILNDPGMVAVARESIDRGGRSMCPSWDNLGILGNPQTPYTRRSISSASGDDPRHGCT